jgi:putative oxidoreductase
MLTAINRVHLKNGPWVSDQGYEYNLVLIAVTLALVETGPGSPSIDDAIGAKWHGPKWAFRSLLFGIIGAVGAHIVAESAPAPEPQPDAEATDAAAEPQAEAAATQAN